MPQMNASDRPVEGGLLSRVFSWLVTHHVREGEVANLSLGDMSELARDLGVSQSDLLTAFQEQLGMKLEATKAQADVFVVDKV